MNEYPEWLIGRVARNIARATYADWCYSADDEANVYRRDAIATLDALGFAPYGGPSYWRSNIQWEAK